MTTNLTWTKSPDGSERSEAHGVIYEIGYSAHWPLLGDGYQIKITWNSECKKYEPWIKDETCKLEKTAKEICSSHAAHISKLVAEAREESKPKWISCAESIPDYNENVVIKEKRGIYIGARITAPGVQFVVLPNCYTSHGVTHWMPLPAPPKTSTSATEEGIV